MNEEKARALRPHKDTLFRMLFKDKGNLLSLYNALNKTAYTDKNQLEITTLENALFMNYKNDVSFVFDFELMLYEHQSTLNPNMPFRDLIYVTRILQGRIAEKTMYGSTPIKLPAPRFVVFYNGTANCPDLETLKLSSLYEKEQEHPDLELIVTVYNINYGKNRDIMECCRVLKDYARFVEQVRKFRKTIPVSEAVEAAVAYCIEHDILRSFLMKNRAEVIDVCIFEYNEELHLKTIKEEGVEEGIRIGKSQGIEIGKSQGIEIGENLLAELLRYLNSAGRQEDINRAISDPDYRQELYQALHIDILNATK